jgi:metallo-beta-lactamase class B
VNSNKVKNVMLSHAHGDHDGGAKMLQDTIPSAHLVYGAEDWDAIDKAQTHMGGKPKSDVTGDDGMTISVGDASLRIVTMPGHTAGTLSYLFEVRDRGKPMRVAYVGGTASPFDANAEYYDRYIASSRKMAKAAADYGATALQSSSGRRSQKWRSESVRCWLGCRLALFRRCRRLRHGRKNPGDR